MDNGSKRSVGRPKVRPQTGPLVLEGSRARVKLDVEIGDDTADEPSDRFESRNTEGAAIVSAVTLSPPAIDATDFEHLPAVLTTREAANALRIGVKELRKLVDAGHIPAARFGPRRVIRIAKAR